MLPLLHQHLLPRLRTHHQLNPLHRRLLLHLQSPVLEEKPDTQPATANMGSLFSSHVITVKNVDSGDINDLSKHYKVQKEAATAAKITFGVIAVLANMGCFWYYVQKARKDLAFTRIQRAARKQMAVSIPMTPYPAPFVPQPPPPPASAPTMYSAPPILVFAQLGPFPVCPQ